jgi:UDP-N-acetylglucosamine 2-epimerase
MLKVINVVGARPNFMKVAPIVAAMKKRQRSFSRSLFTPDNITTQRCLIRSFAISIFLNLTLISASAPVHMQRKRLR